MKLVFYLYFSPGDMGAAAEDTVVCLMAHAEGSSEHPVNQATGSFCV